MEKNDPQAAVLALEKLAQLTPKVAQVHGNLGMSYYALGNYRQAAGSFQKALRLNPGIPRAKLMLGFCYAQLGRAQEAVPILEPAFRHPPDQETGRQVGWLLQRAYSALHDPAKAISVSEEMMRRFPDDPEVLYDASHLHGERAMQITLKLLEVSHPTPWRHMAVAEVHEAQLRYDLAVYEYRQAIRVDPKMPGLHFRLGRILLRLAKDETARREALAAFQDEVAIDPGNSSAWYEIGEIHRQRAELDLALHAFQTATDLQPDLIEARVALARALIAKDRPSESLPHLDAAVRLDPERPITHFLLARAHRALGSSSIYKKEMALFLQFRNKSESGAASPPSEAPSLFGAPGLTPQTVEANQSE